MNEVVEVGSLVKDFKPGDRVLVPAITPDWSSAAAQAGWQQHSGGMLGGWKFSNYKDGVFADFFHVNDADGNLAHLPEGMDPVDACIMSDMVPTGFHAVEQADVQFGDTVLVIGIGPVGLMAVRACALRGASRIMAVGTRPVCMEVAKAYGADEFISYKDGPIFAQVLERTNGAGVDRVCIAGGNVDTFSEAIKCLKPGGLATLTTSVPETMSRSLAWNGALACRTRPFPAVSCRADGCAWKNWRALSRAVASISIRKSPTSLKAWITSKKRSL